MIEIRNLTRRFGQTHAVTDLSLRVETGELLVLLGESGCGKTTTLRMINRLIEPTSGSIHVDGEDTSAIAPHELRRRIGYVFQRIGLFPHMTIADNVGISLRLLGWASERIRGRVDELLALVGLDAGELRDRYPRALSGGQQQRVGVARALAAEPRLMLLDEPFGALDPLTRDHLQQSFLEIRQRLGLTAIFVTHDMAEALLIGDRIAVLQHGRLVQTGTPRELVTQPATDYVRRLMGTPRRQAAAFDALAASEAP